MKKLIGRLISSNPKLDYLCNTLYALPYQRQMKKAFRDYYRFLEEAQYYSADRLKELQFEKLLQTLHYAYSNSPFYKNLYDEHGVNIKSIKSFGDFKKQIPLVKKDMLKNAGDLTVVSERLDIATTSGTSGSPFQFYTDLVGNEINKAAIYHQWAQAGFYPHDKRIEIRGIQSAPIAKVPGENVFRFSAVNMRDNIKEMIRFMNDSRIKYIHGYPSAIAKLCLLLRDNKLAVDYQIKGVFLASENVYEWQVDIINDCLMPENIIAHYGCAERIALGSWCKTNKVYHFNPLYGYLEKGELGNVIGTGFINKATPFIRYQMNDMLLDWSDSPCPECGRGYTPLVTKIGGRLEDYLVDEKDELIPPAVVTFPFKNLKVITSVQIVQTKDKDVILNCIVNKNGNGLVLEKEKNKLSFEFKKLLGQSIDIHFNEVDEIKLTDSFKFKWIVSEAVKPQID